MKTPVVAVLLFGLLVVPPAHAEGTQGEVTKVDSRRNRVTVKHGPIENLDMPAMTMVFELADPAMISQVPVGRTITFTADRIEGKLTIVGIE